MTPTRLERAAAGGVERALRGLTLPRDRFRELVRAVEARLATVPGLARDPSLWRVARALAVRVLQEKEREAQRDER